MGFADKYQELPGNSPPITYSIIPGKDTASAIYLIQLRADGGEEIMRCAMPRQRRLAYGHATRLTVDHATR
ncbi:MAG: hypothetical protein F6K26_49530 [Moorea sp. SIO2I5]|nr:hypothetical protein [Moorena sp. SIO2I5]